MGGRFSSSFRAPDAEQTPSHIVLATFKFISIDAKEQFIQIASSPDGIPKTRASKGCRLIQVLQNQNEACTLTIRQEWDSQADHEAYFEERRSSGMIDSLKEMMEGEIDIQRYEDTKL